MTEQNEEVVAEIRAAGNIDLEKGEVQISVARGGASISVSFPVEEELDEYGLGDVDYLINGLGQAVEQVIEVLRGKMNAGESDDA